METTISMKNAAPNRFFRRLLLACAVVLLPFLSLAEVKIYVNFTSEQSGCEPLRVSFKPILTYSDSLNKPVIRSYEWEFGDGEHSNEVAPVHFYTVQDGSKVQKYTCTLTITTMDWYAYAEKKNNWITVRRTPRPKIVDNPGLTTIARPDINFDADTLVSSNIDFQDSSTKFLWSFGDRNNPDQGGTSRIKSPQYTYKDTGKFRVLLNVYSNGCIGKDSVSIFIGPQLLVFIPNVFKPNGLHNTAKASNFFPGNVNEVFKPVVAFYTSYSLTIYSKLGDPYFISTNPTVGWNGKFYGLDCPEGTYVYILRVTNSIGKESTFQGFVTLIR